MTKPLDEEAKGLLRRIVESQAYRQIMAMNILGHCLKFVQDLDDKMRLTEELGASQRIFREVRTLYRQLGWKGLESAVRDRMERIPYPESRIEFSVCLHLCNLAERVAMQAYVDSTSGEFAAVARSYLELSSGLKVEGAANVTEFCSEPGNRPRAQQFVNRWLAIALTSFGRPGSPGDARAVELGLRSRRSSEMIGSFLAEVRPFLAECGLTMPDAETLDLDLPPGLAGAGTARP